MDERTPPHSLEAERCVIGSLLLDDSKWDEIASVLKQKDFYDEFHQEVFKACGNIKKKGHKIDAVLILEYLNHADCLEHDYMLLEMANNVPTASNLMAYADIVREKSRLRDLIKFSNKVAIESSSIKDKQQLLDFITKVEKFIKKLDSKWQENDKKEEVDPILMQKIIDKLNE